LNAVLPDTHAWIWSRMAPGRMVRPAKSAIVEADSVFVSPVGVYEVTRKARLGGWPEIVPRLGELVAEAQTMTAPFTRAIAARAGILDGSHRDPFDRLIAATAIELRYPFPRVRPRKLRSGAPRPGP